jgi:GTP cyclohydrolase III
VDLADVRIALRTPVEVVTPAYVRDVIAELAATVERKARAGAGAAIGRGPATVRATLKSAMAVERARQHMRAELRLVGTTPGLVDEPARLRLCG